MDDYIKASDVLDFITQMRVRAMKACDYNEESEIFKTANSTLSTVEQFILQKRRNDDDEHTNAWRRYAEEL